MNYDINNYTIDSHFVSNIFKTNRADFLPTVLPIFDEYIAQSKSVRDPKDPYPGIMTSILSNDERLFNFVSYISDISWDILDKQGYNMNLYYTNAQEMWGQFHPKDSSMVRHFHGKGSYLTGFYFLETPEDSSQVTFYDPRQIKTFNNLPVKNSDELQHAHTSVWYKPKAGDIYFTDSWIEHSFSPNKSHNPYKFIHINISVVPREENTPVII